MNAFVENGRRLFEYLAALQKTKETPVEKTKDYERSGGMVIPLHSLTQFVGESKISVGSDIQKAFETVGPVGSFRADNPTLLVEFNRFDVPRFPTVPLAVEPWIDGNIDSSTKAPVIREKISTNETDLYFESEKPSTRDAVFGWMKEWEDWAKEDRYQAQYDKAFQLNSIASENADEFEVVLGIGNLRWKTGIVDLDRHIFTIPLSVSRESKTGSIKVEVFESILKLESDSIPMEDVADSTFVNRVREALEEIEEDLLAEPTFNDVANTLAMSITTRGQYEPVFNKAEAQSVPVEIPQLTWAPTIILRKKGKLGLSQVFSDISEEIEENQRIPDGLAALIDPNSAVNTVEESIPGGVFEVDNEIYSPLPLNDRQIDVLRRVDNYNQTIVQGPPGTGKTHMAAALLSHLLAQGKRVLVTAEKERALYELRDKLPAEIRELAVSVIGTQSAEQVELQNAINVIDGRAANFSSAESANQINAHKHNLERLRESSIALRRAWYKQLELENSPVQREGYGTNLAEAVRTWQSEEESYRWIRDFHVTNLSRKFPLAPNEVAELFVLQTQFEDQELPEIFSSTDSRTQGIRTPEEFESEINKLAGAQQVVKKFQGTKIPDNARSLERMSDAQRSEFSEKLTRLEQIEIQVGSLKAPWHSQVFHDVQNGRIESWERTLAEFECSVVNANQALSYVSQFRKIEVNGNFSRFMHSARELLKHIKSSGPLKTTASGMPKMGFMTNKVVKESKDFFSSVLVDGIAPSTEDTVSAYIAYVNLRWELEKMPELWPYSPETADVSHAQQVDSYQADLRELRSIIDLAKEKALLIQHANTMGIVEDGASPIHRAVIDCEELTASEMLIRDTEKEINGFKFDADLISTSGAKISWVSNLNSAVIAKDPKKYAVAFNQLSALRSRGTTAKKYQERMDKLREWSPLICNALVSDGFSDVWKARLQDGESARRWKVADEKIQTHSSVEFHQIQAKITENDKAITREISKLAERRAWHHALDNDRIDANMRKTLKSYTQAVKRLGKGTGKNAEKKRRDVRRHLNNCRGAVPVWIMPISRAIEQFTFEENMFDVVIVDEASQAGLDSIFLQYLAKKVVVIGDDQQVSPSAVGVNEGEIQKLANQYIRDFEDRDAWTDPRRSLFEEADMRYGGRIVLNEHRRCVPEIIEFSNELTYRPNQIELVPVREVKPGRLAPFKITQTINAPVSGKAPKKINRQEANVLVAKLVECLNDPSYAGKTMGVISLLSSTAQIDYLRARLSEVVQPEVWDARDLRVGNPADFQGSERDVVFLSMVESADPDARRSSLTNQTYIQRYNVAVSRAKDQIQLFHSVGVENLHNVNDVRHKLLTYAYRVALSAPEENHSSLVSNDYRDDRFDSLFEQRVYNRIVARGFTATPQYKALHYNIDLVVEGNGRRLAIECDGDYWHSAPEAVENDRRRQSALERAGWKFVRIFESDFYLDEQEQMERVWQALEALQIEPNQVDGTEIDPVQNVELIESVDDWMIKHGFLQRESGVTSQI